MFIFLGDSNILLHISFYFELQNVYLDREGTEKSVCEAIFERNYIVYLHTWCNIVTNAYGSTGVRPSRDNQIFSPSWVYYTFLSMEAPLKLRCYAREWDQNNSV